MREQIKKIAQNAMLKFLQDAPAENGYDQFVEAMISMDPYMPIHVTCLYENSPWAIQATMQIC